MTEYKETKHERKELLDRIRTQMEFYFSEANLSKDRFLKQELQSAEDGCMYLKFRLFFKWILYLTVYP